MLRALSSRAAARAAATAAAAAAQTYPVAPNGAALELLRSCLPAVPTCPSPLAPLGCQNFHAAVRAAATTPQGTPPEDGPRKMVARLARHRPSSGEDGEPRGPRDRPSVGAKQGTSGMEEQGEGVGAQQGGPKDSPDGSKDGSSPSSSSASSSASPGDGEGKAEDSEDEARDQKWREELENLRTRSDIEEENRPTPWSPLWSQIMEVFDSGMMYIATKCITTQVETSFEEEEFIEGAKDALVTVLDTVSAADWESAEDMLSDKMLTDYQKMLDVYKAAGLVPSMEVTDLGSRTSLVGLRAMRASEMETFDKPRVQAARLLNGQVEGDEDTALWLVAVVRFADPTIVCRTCTADDGTLKQVITDQTPKVLVFARGPLPDIAEMPVRQLEQDWFLLKLH